jgi:hypothetical protein
LGSALWAREVATANAHLIAAAPDLLELLAWCVHHEGGQCLGDHPNIYQAALAAIAKATEAT